MLIETLLAFYMRVCKHNRHMTLHENQGRKLINVQIMHIVRTACPGVLRVGPSTTVRWLYLSYGHVCTISCKKCVTCCTQRFSQQCTFGISDLPLLGNETKVSDNTDYVQSINLHVYVYLLLSF